VRTWTFVSHRVDWFDDAGHWQDRARAIEDRLSDALHQRLTQRFVDRRAAALARARDKDMLSSHIAESGDVQVEGEFVGRLDGFMFAPDRDGHRALLAAAVRAVAGEISARLGRLVADPDEVFLLDNAGMVTWKNAAVARLVPGETALAPRVAPMVSDLVTPEQRDRIRARIADFIARRVAAELGAVARLREATLGGAARGIAFQLSENLGSLPRRSVQLLLAGLSADDRLALVKLGVRVGMESVYMPALLKAAPVRLRGLLWSIHRSRPNLPPLPEGRVSVPVEPGVPPAYYEACGFPVVAGRAIRADMLDRFAVQLSRLARAGDFAATPALLSLLGLTAGAAIPVIVALGYRPTEAGPTTFARSRRKPPRGPRRQARSQTDSPFAALDRLKRS
jgi:ATP-dependent RNA helicase SUPV3L1/SUV3